MRIFAADISFLEQPELFRRYSLHVSAERAGRAAAFAAPKNKAQSLGAALLFAHALSAYEADIDNSTGRKTAAETKSAPPDFSYSEDGKPYIKNKPHLQFNLSHSGSFAVCAIGSGKNGIDIEHCRKEPRALTGKCFTKEELLFLDSSADEQERLTRFLLLWTRKESYVKALGKGLREKLAGFSVISADSTVRFVSGAAAPETDNTLSKEIFFCKTYQNLPQMPQYTISVCSTNNDFPQNIEMVQLHCSSAP